MIVALAAGWALQQYAEVPNAMLFGLFGGLLAAQFLPGTACAVPRRPATRSGDGD